MLTGLGMGLLGNVADRLGRKRPACKLLARHDLHPRVVRVCSWSPSGCRRAPATPVVLGLGVFVVSGTWGPAAAAVAHLVPTAIHSTAMAVITLLNNLIGLAPGPFVTGLCPTDTASTSRCSGFPLVSVVSASALYLAYRHYDVDALRKQGARVTNHPRRPEWTQSKR